MVNKLSFTRHKESFPCSQHFVTGFCSEPDESRPQPRIFLILSFHLYLSLSSGLSPSGLRTKFLYTFCAFPMHATCYAHLIVPYLFAFNFYLVVYMLRSYFIFSSLIFSPPSYIELFPSDPCRQTTSFCVIRL